MHALPGVKPCMHEKAQQLGAPDLLNRHEGTGLECTASPPTRTFNIVLYCNSGHVCTELLPADTHRIGGVSWLLGGGGGGRGCIWKDTLLNQSECRYRQTLMSCGKPTCMQDSV